MNLAWIAAVLSPRDVTGGPHAESSVADLVRGRVSRGEPDDPLLRAATRSLGPATIEEAVPELAGLVREAARGDLARAAAYGLLLACAAAELDDYDTLFLVLDELLDAVPADDADGSLVRAALLQQKALRLRDAGLPHLASSRDALAALDLVQPGRCTPFEPRPGREFTEVLATVVGNLRGAIGSLVDVRESEGSELTRRATSERAREYTNYVKGIFKDTFERRRRVVFGGGPADLFVSALALEIAGHRDVYPARREHATLRLLQMNRNVTDAADVLRLLRHSTAKAELTLVLRSLGDAGPLLAIARDARQILRRRTAPHLLRTVELQVLQSGADLLTAEEARRGMDAVLALLDAGGPANLPGTRQVAVLRRATAWSAAVALANVCDSADDIAGRLLAEALSATEDDPLVDGELRREVGALDWDRLSGHSRSAWLAACAGLAELFPGTTELVARRSGQPAAVPAEASPLDRLAARINLGIIRPGHVVEVTEEDTTLLRAMLSGTRSTAATGAYSFGGPQEADIAAAAIVLADATGLWPDLAAYLLDPRVSQDDRDRAFDRLARSDLTLPAEIAALFRDGLRRTIVDASAPAFSAPLVPFPAALRFGAVHGLLPRAEVYDLLARLLGSTSAEARREGVRTVVLLADKAPEDTLLAMVLPFATDENVEVRATTTAALMRFARHESPLARLARERVDELIDSDGILVATAVLTSAEEDPDGLARHYLARLGEHPAHSIRRRAARGGAGRPHWRG
jgi:hypothetical protein